MCIKFTLDRLHSEIDERFTRLQDTDAKFGFHLDIIKLCCSDNKNELKTNCYTFGEFYSSDVNAQDLYEEILDCRLLLSRRVAQKVSTPEELPKCIVEYGDHSVFPNLRVAIQIMLTIAVSITGCERSFSKLKLILSYLWATVGQDTLSDLALLTVERGETEKTQTLMLL